MELHLRTKDIDFIEVRESFKTDYYFKEFKKGSLFNNDTKEGFYSDIYSARFVDTLDFFIKSNRYSVKDNVITQKDNVSIHLFNRCDIETVYFDDYKSASEFASKISKGIDNKKYITITHNY